ncbi:hypothetical protein XINFAN_01230 [Pseudogemmobacter humi]|uniref:Uncharacterized protein n=1 Tax=Pseudogemmobacter humi TaxID=2483812 RepID=A0A3P5X838_9RHOB|nr:hypothetical protein XINFAN_01230 [Pseudogemmobacter humi]
MIEAAPQPFFLFGLADPFSLMAMLMQLLS